jgi:hypothetical protein
MEARGHRDIPLLGPTLLAIDAISSYSDWPAFTQGYSSRRLTISSGEPPALSSITGYFTRHTEEPSLAVMPAIDLRTVMLEKLHGNTVTRPGELHPGHLWRGTGD